MPDMTESATSVANWLRDNAIPLLLLFGLAFIAFRGARPLIHRVLTRAIHIQHAAAGESPAYELEVERRVATIEDLLNKLIRLGVVLALVAILLGVFDLWSLVAGLGLALAAVAFAGQSVILDLIMGVLILLEAQYFKGDVVSVNGITGTVEEVGIRRTVIRDTQGTLHSVSNGLIRQSSNFTRTYALATVDIDGVRDRDVEAVIELLDEVGRTLADDEEIGPLLQDVPGYTSTVRLSATGATLRLAGRTVPEARYRVEAEMRRRVAARLAAGGIELIRPGVQAPVR